MPWLNPEKVPPPQNETLLLKAGGSLFFGFYSTLRASWFILIPSAPPEQITDVDAYFADSPDGQPLTPAPPTRAPEKQLFLF